MNAAKVVPGKMRGALATPAKQSQDIGDQAENITFIRLLKHAFRRHSEPAWGKQATRGTILHHMSFVR
jgi:hypothetical protein